MSRLLFGGLFVVTLLGLFIYGLIKAIEAANNCAAGTVCAIEPEYVIFLHTIGALVSAVVVSELAVTKPLEAPGTAHIQPNDSPTKVVITKILASLYVMTWFVAGLVALMVSTKHKGVEPLTDLGKQWIGFFVAAGYAYFGLSR